MACITDACGIRILCVVLLLSLPSLVSWAMWASQFIGKYAHFCWIPGLFSLIAIVSSFTKATSGVIEKLEGQARLLKWAAFLVFIPPLTALANTRHAETLGVTLWSIWMCAFFLWMKNLFINRAFDSQREQDINQQRAEQAVHLQQTQEQQLRLHQQQLQQQQQQQQLQRDQGYRSQLEALSAAGLAHSPLVIDFRPTITLGQPQAAPPQIPVLPVTEVVHQAPVAVGPQMPYPAAMPAGFVPAFNPHYPPSAPAPQ